MPGDVLAQVPGQASHGAQAARTREEWTGKATPEEAQALIRDLTQRIRELENDRAAGNWRSHGDGRVRLASIR